MIEIRGFLPASLSEWDGKICAVIFTPRCDWRCPYCHGWRFVCEDPSLPLIEVATVFRHLEQQREWLDGVVISGGEPTLQPHLADFLQAIKERGLAVKLETNGSRPQTIATLLERRLIDCLCLDYKAPLDERLFRAIGLAEKNPQILTAVQRSFALAAASGVEREYHTTLCPAFVDAAALEEMAAALEPDGVWVLQQYEPADCLAPAAAGARQYDATELAALWQVAQRRHRRVLLRPGRSQTAAARAPAAWREGN
ncbi:MAG: anaerobic ribonucleoside-triphosphate reductase activating protein [Planctomycetota bacterium]|nr:anaerobic ribonucleoside-triphosphate reductase activating protein [Planctomycetota bacterium]